MSKYICFVGDSTVGKTALAQSFASDGTQFAKSYNMVRHTPFCHLAVAKFVAHCIVSDTLHSKLCNYGRVGYSISIYCTCIIL